MPCPCRDKSRGVAGTGNASLSFRQFLGSCAFSWSFSSRFTPLALPPAESAFFSAPMTGFYQKNSPRSPFFFLTCDRLSAIAISEALAGLDYWFLFSGCLFPRGLLGFGENFLLSYGISNNAVIVALIVPEKQIRTDFQVVLKPINVSSFGISCPCV